MSRLTQTFCRMMRLAERLRPMALLRRFVMPQWMGSLNAGSSLQRVLQAAYACRTGVWDFR